MLGGGDVAWCISKEGRETTSNEFYTEKENKRKGVVKQKNKKGGNCREVERRISREHT